MRSPIRLVWRGGTMAQKLDACPTCGVVGRHSIERQVRWLSIGPIPILPTGIRHGIECHACRAWEPLPWAQLWPALRAGRLPLPGRHRTVGAGVGPASAATGPVTEPAAVASGEPAVVAPVDFDRLKRSRSLDGATVSVGIWALIVAILVGLAIQPSIKETVADEHIPWCLKVDGVALGSPYPTLTTSTAVVQTLCVFPHTYEPIASPDAAFAPGATLPPGPGFGAQVDTACKAAFTRVFGRAPDGSNPWLGEVGPGPSAWAGGTRRVWCVVADPSQAWTTTILAPSP